MTGRMPVARQKNGKPAVSESPEVGSQRRKDRIAPGDAERAAGKKVVLNVSNEQGITGTKNRHRATSSPVPQARMSVTVPAETVHEYRPPRPAFLRR